MTTMSIGRKILLVSLATALLVLSAGMAWATAYEYMGRERVPSGVSVNGFDLSGMSEEDARTTIGDAVAAPLLRPVAVEADGKEFTFDPRGAVAVDVEAMLDAAFAPRRNASFLDRLQHDLLDGQLTGEVEPAYSLDPAKLSEWISEVAAEIDRPAIDATRTVDVNVIRIEASEEGRRTMLQQASQLLSEAFEAEAALTPGERRLELPVKTLKPKVTEDSFGKSIVVDLSERRIRLFEGDKLEKTYPCAIGTPGYPTPQGEYEITLKRYMPTWVNPGSAWALDMPRSIPPGPNNPLGTRALNISAPGIRFHGTSNIASVGTAASHGCMRMYQSHIEDLYERVEIGTKVYIVP